MRREMRQPWSTEPCYLLRAGCCSPILLSLREASEGRDSPSVRLVAPEVAVLGGRGWEILCLHPPGAGTGCCNITRSFGSKRGAEPTNGDVQLQCFLSKGKKNKTLL